MDIKLAKTARDKILEQYENGAQEYEFRTTPIMSVAQLQGDVVNVDTVNKIAYLKFKPQKVTFFRQGDGDQLNYGATKVNSTEAETNLQKGGSTDGARDMAIEGISLGSAGNIVQYFDDGAAIVGFGTAPTDEDVKAALYGQGQLCDPFGLVVPSQLQSPYLLEDMLFQEIVNKSTVEIQTDTSRPYQVGGADLMPGAAGSSFKRANGNPDTGNVFAFPEGILWQRDGKSDSDIKVVFELHRTLIVPISLVTPPGGTVLSPKKVWQRLRMRLHGMSVSDLGNN